MSGTKVVVPVSARLDRARNGSLEALSNADIMDKAKASDAFAKLVKDMGATEEEGLDALELAIRIQREAGRRLFSLNPRKQASGRPKKKGDKKVPFLLEAGISKKQSSRWQKVAKLSPEAFEEFVLKKRSKIDKVAMDGAVKEPSLGGTDGDIQDPDEYYTLEEHIALVRELMGGIDLDPASNEIANTVVKAKRYFTKEEDGLTRPWKGRIFVNWPTSKAAPFATKLLTEIALKNVTQAVALDPAVDPSVVRFHELAGKLGVCFVKGRINFDREDGETSGNRYAQAFFYYGPNRKEFIKIFRQIGMVGWLR